MKRINTLEQLREIAKREEPVELFIHLNGNARSSKDVIYDEDSGWMITHEIDNVTEYYKNDTEFMKHEEFFFEAMEKGALYEY